MRELKLRAWSNYHKKMYEVQSIDFFFGLMQLYTWEDNEHGTLTKVNSEEEAEIPCEIDPDGSLLDEVFGYEVMQYTGINDIKETEIYEGDIIKRSSVAPGGKDFLGVVEFNEGSFWIKNDNDSILLFTEIDELEVLGDIYRNPELLKED